MGISVTVPTIPISSLPTVSASLRGGKGRGPPSQDRKGGGTCPKSQNQFFLTPLALVSSCTSLGDSNISPKPLLIPPHCQCFICPRLITSL